MVQTISSISIWEVMGEPWCKWGTGTCGQHMGRPWLGAHHAFLYQHQFSTVWVGMDSAWGGAAGADF